MKKVITVVNPETGDIIETIELQTAEQVRKIVETASETQELWKRTPLIKRGELMYRLADLLDANAERIGLISTAELGKPIMQSIAENHDSANIIRANVERAKHLYGDVLTDNSPGLEKDIVFTKREPLGVIGCIIPFNFPVELTFQKIAPALIMGNVVVVKVPTFNPLAVLQLRELIKTAGFPDGVAQFAICDRHVISECIVKNPKVDAISMTGSTSVGVQISKDGADTLKRIFLELGGNDSLIIFDDVNVNLAVAEIINGRFENNGQVCCSSKRIIVQEGIQEELVLKLIEAVKGLKIGSAMERDTIISTLVTEQAAIEVENQIQQTVEQGGRIVFGGKRIGARIEPTILVGVTKDMDISGSMEIFGPVVPIITFKTEAEAVEIANASPYGLSSGVLSGDLVRAFRVGERMKSGTAVVNGSGLYRHLDHPFGGVKMSGVGREGAGISLEEFSNIKVYVMKGFINS